MSSSIRFKLFAISIKSNKVWMIWFVLTQSPGHTLAAPPPVWSEWPGYGRCAQWICRVLEIWLQEYNVHMQTWILHSLSCLDSDQTMIDSSMHDTLITGKYLLPRPRSSKKLKSGATVTFSLKFPVDGDTMRRFNIRKIIFWRNMIFNFLASLFM